MNWKKNSFVPYFAAGHSAPDVQTVLFSSPLGLLWSKTTNFFFKQEAVYSEKVIHATFHSTAPELAPIANAPTILSKPYVLTYPNKATWYASRAPITNLHPIKNISAMSWGHNGRPSGGPSITEILLITEHCLGLWGLFLKHDHLCSRLWTSSSVLWVIQR